MSFSNQWNYLYSNNTNISIWPWSDLISLYFNYFNKKNKKKIRILELGCGAGANIPFFLNKKFDYYGLDGSNYIIKKLKKRYPKIKRNLVCADFTKQIPFNLKFDLIIDRASITCNNQVSIKNTINFIYNKLNKKGMFIGIDWYSTLTTDFKKGEFDKDKYTKKNMKNSIFKGAGSFHFCNEKLIKNYFKNFKVKNLEHKLIEYKINKKKLATWTIVVEK